MVRNFALAALLLSLCLGGSSCSLLAPSMQTLSIVATDPNAVIMVDGQRVGKGQASVPVKRNRSHAITGTTSDGRSSAATVSTKISGVGYVDLIGGILVFWPALIGCCTPGFRSIETDTVTLVF